MPELVQRVLSRDRASIAAALNLTEDRRPAARRELSVLMAGLRGTGALDRSHRVGITGPPGVGKSTLVSAITRALRSDNAANRATVGVLAVDPSSIRSGGALLGDRTRIAPDPSDSGIFVRSRSEERR